MNNLSVYAVLVMSVYLLVKSAAILKPSEVGSLLWINLIAIFGASILIFSAKDLMVRGASLVSIAVIFLLLIPKFDPSSGRKDISESVVKIFLNVSLAFFLILCALALHFRNEIMLWPLKAEDLNESVLKSCIFSFIIGTTFLLLQIPPAQQGLVDFLESSPKSEITQFVSTYYIVSILGLFFMITDTTFLSHNNEAALVSCFLLIGITLARLVEMVQVHIYRLHGYQMSMLLLPLIGRGFLQKVRNFIYPDELFFLSFGLIVALFVVLEQRIYKNSSRSKPLLTQLDSENFLKEFSYLIIADQIQSVVWVGLFLYLKNYVPAFLIAVYLIVVSVLKYKFKSEKLSKVTV